MGAAGEKVCRLGGGQGIAFFLEQSHISCQSCRVAGHIDDAFWLHTAQSFYGIGIQTLSGRVYHHHIRADALLLQSKGGFSRVAAEKFRVSFVFGRP